MRILFLLFWSEVMNSMSNYQEVGNDDGNQPEDSRDDKADLMEGEAVAVFLFAID